MALFDTLSNVTDENATATLHALLRGLQAKVTRATVHASLLQHPDFPSLLSLSETLTDWQIDNTALQLNTVEQLRELPFPFIAHLHKNNGWYVLVTALQGDTITYTDNTDGRKTESLTDFEPEWSGVVLLAEANNQSGEADYAVHRRQEILDNLRGPFVLTGALLVFLIVILSVAKDLTAPDWLLLLTKATGLTLSGLLVAKQLGSKNALTDRLCSINSKTNCDDVLNSPAAKLWGWLSWADVGLLYFAGGLLTLLLVSFQPDVRPLLHGLALLALPYTLFSVYYQGFVLRNWCPLCLGVQGVLLIEGILAVTQLSLLSTSIQPYLLLSIAFLLPTLAWVIVKPLLTNLPKSRREHEELMRLKRDPNLFRALLMQQPQMPPIPDDLHPVVLGNSNAGHTITMVTNPYCEPCATVHEKFEELVRDNVNVKLNVVFACNRNNESMRQSVLHLLALSRELPPERVLADWYENGRKDFAAWAAAQPVSYDSVALNMIIDSHSSWCEEASIDRTPTLFIDGYLLPSLYRFNTLRWLINYLPATAPKTDLAKST